jgi:phosphate:Na+ symporter
MASVEDMRARVLNTGSSISPAEKGAILAILGSVERAHLLVNRIDAERKSVNRSGVLAKINAAAAERGQRGFDGDAVPAPAE